MPSSEALAYFLSLLVVSTAGTGLARRYALRRQLLDQPGERRSHRVPTPRGGGAGPVVAILLALGALASWLPGQAVPMLASLGAVALVALIGWVDDHRPLSAGVRLIVHVVAAATVATGFGLWSTSPMLWLLALLACTTLINVWNFMDGIDGLAASQAALVAAFAACLASVATAPAVGIAAACLGFLPFNFPRARIFMGDVGSGAIGLALAVLLVSAGRQSWPAALAVLLTMSAFLTDSGMTLSRRVMRGERWWTPHTQHLYQRLARVYGHPRVTLAYAAWTMLAGVTALILAGHAPGLMLPFVIMWYMASAALWWWLQRNMAEGTGACMEKDR